MRFAIGVLSVLVIPMIATAAVKTQVVTYTYEGTQLKGYLAYDDSISGKRPGVMIVHEWWGLDDYARKRAQQLAALGYVAFAADMYGEGKTTTHPKEAGEMAGAVRNNVAVWEGRAKAGLKALSEQPQVDASKLAAIGYCFGGSTVLQLALSGADVKAVVSFHGALPNVTPQQAKAIKARLLLCHGADDPFIPEEATVKFRAALAGVDYQFIAYGGVQHSFTVEGVDAKGIQGLKYSPTADARSWTAMRNLFTEVFGQ